MIRGHIRVRCLFCQCENQPENKYCGQCGKLLDPAQGPLQEHVDALVEQRVKEVLKAELRDQKVVEIEASEAVVDRLTAWAKILAICVSVPLAILGVVLGVMGFRTYSDFDKIQNKSEEVSKQVNQTLVEAQRVQQQMADASTALNAISKLQSDAAQLQSEVSKVSGALAQQQRDQDQLNKRVQQQLAEASAALQTASKLKSDAAELQNEMSAVRASLAQQQQETSVVRASLEKQQQNLSNLNNQADIVQQTLVSQAQVRLKALGLYEGVISGRLDEPTRTAVAAFQRKAGIAADGIPGPQTLALLNSK